MAYRAQGAIGSYVKKPNAYDQNNTGQLVTSHICQKEQDWRSMGAFYILCIICIFTLRIYAYST